VSWMDAARPVEALPAATGAKAVTAGARARARISLAILIVLSARERSGYYARNEVALLEVLS